MNAYLEVAGLSLTDQQHRQGFDLYRPAIGAPRPRGRIATGVSSLLVGVKAWIERQRLASDLNALDDRLLADAGLTRGDIPAVLRGTFERKPESAPVQWPRARKAPQRSTTDHEGTQIAA